MNVIITGATGMIGKGVLLECLDHESITKVLIIGRNSIGMVHPKLEEAIHSDFKDYSAISEKLKGYDACYFCLGVSSAGMDADKYEEITYGFTLSLAKTLFALNPDMTFNYVSGEGTDSTEKGRTRWARVKGKTENDVLALGFKQAFMFRPGAIIPLRDIKSRTPMYQFIYDYFMWLVKFFKAIAPNSVVNTTDIGLAMIHTTLKGYDKSVLRPKDILIAAKS